MDGDAIRDGGEGVAFLVGDRAGLTGLLRFDLSFDRRKSISNGSMKHVSLTVVVDSRSVQSRNFDPRDVSSFLSFLPLFSSSFLSFHVSFKNCCQ